MGDGLGQRYRGMGQRLREITQVRYSARHWLEQEAEMGDILRQAGLESRAVCD